MGIYYLFLIFVNFLKMKIAILASLIASAAAFAPSKNGARTSTVSKMSFEEELGAQPPLGFYDPFGIVDGVSEEKFNRLRATEIKHGRVSMLAVVGYLLEYAHVTFGGDIDKSGTKFSDIGYGFAAIKNLPTAGLVQLIAFVGFLELAVMKDITGGEFVGDFRNNSFDLGWDTFDDETKLQKRAIELNQGRAAMMGILGLMVHEQLGVPILPGTP